MWIPGDASRERPSLIAVQNWRGGIPTYISYLEWYCNRYHAGCRGADSPSSQQRLHYYYSTVWRSALLQKPETQKPQKSMSSSNRTKLEEATAEGVSDSRQQHTSPHASREGSCHNLRLLLFMLIINKIIISFSIINIQEPNLTLFITHQRIVFVTTTL